MNEKYLEGSEELVQKLTDWRIEEVRAGSTGIRPVDYDGTCPDCGIAVPPARVALAFYNCVDCQTEEERRTRMEKCNGKGRES